MAPNDNFMPPGRGPVPNATSQPDVAALQPNIGALLHDVARLMRRRFERYARQTGLPVTRLQARVLLCIARNEGGSQAAVAALLDIEPIALVRALDRLREEDLVDRRPHPSDRRVWTLWLTDRAWRMVDSILSINHGIREEACAGLTPADRHALLDTLARMKENLASVEAAAAPEPE